MTNRYRTDDCDDGADEQPSCVFRCQPPQCSEGCAFEQRGDGVCNNMCFTAACNYDDGDCESCADGCYEWLRSDGVCNPACANAQVLATLVVCTGQKLC